MGPVISNNFSDQQDNQNDTRLKRSNGKELSSCNGPTACAGPIQKRVKSGNTQSTCVEQGEVEAPGRSSRGQTSVVPSHFTNSTLVDPCNEKSNSSHLDLPEKGDKVNSKDSKGVRSGQNAKEPTKCEKVCEKMKEILATEDLTVGELVWAQVDKRTPAWPAVIIDPQQQAPEVIRRLTLLYIRFQGQRVGYLKDRFRAAIDEAFSAQRGSNEHQSKVAEEPTCSVNVEVASRSIHDQRSPSEDITNVRDFSPKSKAKGKKKAPPRSCSSPDIAGCDNVNSREGIPEKLPVFCENFKGFYLPKEHLISCQCSSCMGKKLTPAAFERHSGSLKKNWKRAVMIEKSMQLLEDWMKSNEVGTKIKQSNARTTVRQKLDELLQVASTPVIAKWTIERCAICWICGDSDSDKMIICNRCQVAVHQNCYGAQDINDITSWACWACKNTQVNRNCCLCPIKGGALKRTDIGDLWVHVTCAMFQSTVSFLEDITMEPTVCIRKISLESFEKNCTICNQTHGACTKCCECSTYYHAMCAMRAGYRMESHNSRRQGKEINRPCSYCSNHGGVDPNTGLVVIDQRAEEVDSRPELPENSERLSTSSVEADLPAKNFEEGSCARCRVYRKEDKKRREEAVAHLVMGPRLHSVEDIDNKTQPNKRGPITFSTFNERLQHLKRTENLKVCLGKSGIHGWGLFARRPIQEGEMIIEYLGELIRSSISDIREKRYQSQNKDCYFFQISDGVVIDATDKGNLARLINHSCQPNCFARKLAMGETTRLVYIAKEDISSSQELTLDYMFDMAKSEEIRVPCFCNAPNCRGYMA